MNKNYANKSQSKFSLSFRFTSYFIKKQVLVLFLFISLSNYSFGQTSPGGVAGASLWFAADSGITTGTNFTWSNKGELTNAEATNTGDAMPTLVNSGTDQINFNPIVRFDGVNDELITASLTNVDGGTSGAELSTQFVVYRAVTNQINKPIYHWSSNNAGWNLGALADGQLVKNNISRSISIVEGDEVLNDMTSDVSSANQILNYQRNGNDTDVVSSGNYNGLTRDHPFRMGAYNDLDYAQVDIAEIIIYPSILSDTERLKVQSYLALKYGLSLGNNIEAKNYVSSTETVIWDANSTYRHDIFGVGEDSGSGLSQLQSNSMNTGTGDGVYNNLLNHSGNISISVNSLNDGQFLIIGNNDGSLNGINKELPSGLEEFLRVQREWKVRNTNNVGTIDLKFSLNRLSYSGTLVSDFKLLIDLDGNGDFTDGTVTQIDASLLESETITFSGVTLPDNAIFTIITGPAVGPGVYGANLWLKGNEGVSENSGNLIDWIDQTGINTFTPLGSPQTGSTNINFNNTVDFDGVDDMIVGSNNITYNTLYAVYRIENPGTDDSGNLDAGGTLLGLRIYNGAMAQGGKLAVDGAGEGRFYSSGFLGSEKARLTNIEIVEGETATGQKTHIDGELFSTLSASGMGAYLNPVTGVLIGRSWDTSNYAFLEGQVAEILIYPVIHSTLERKKIESYLAIKYGISLGNNTLPAIYISSSELAIYANSTFKFDVFGIGRDDAYQLNQPQSNSINTGSGDGIGQAGKGNIVISNPASLDDEDFLMIGHNNGALTEQSTDLPNSENCVARLAREWKVDRTNDPGTVTLTFDLNGLTVSGADISDFKLLIDSDGDGDFTSGASSVMASSLTNNILTFDNLTLADGVVFTFITGKENIQPSIETLNAISVNTDVGECTFDMSQLPPPATNDNCGVLSTVPSPSVLSLGLNTVTWTVTDNSGNTNSSMQEITVVDNVAPIVSCPSIQLVNPGAGNLYTLPDYFGTSEATAVDYCTSPITILTQSPNPGTQLADGVHTITFSAEDASGNIGSCSFDLTVDSTLGLDDNLNVLKGVKLYPNPTSSIVKIQNLSNIKLSRLTIYDIMGRVINSIDLKQMGEDKEIDLSTFESAVYLFEIHSEQGKLVKSVVKK